MKIKWLHIFFWCIAALSATQIVAQSFEDFSYRLDPLLVKADSLLIFEDYAAAIQNFEAAIHDLKESKTDVGYIYGLNQLVKALIGKEAFNIAHMTLLKADQEGAKLLESSHPERARTIYLFGCYFKQLDNVQFHQRYHLKDQDSLAQAYLDSSFNQLKQVLPQKHEYKGDVYYEKALISSLNNRKAEELLKNALENYPNTGLIKFKKAATSIVLGQQLRNRGDTELGATCVQSAVKILEVSDPVPYKLQDRAYSQLAYYYVGKDEHQKAIRLFLRIIDLRRSRYGNLSEKIISPLANLGSQYVELRSNKAPEFLHQALKLSLIQKDKNWNFLGFIHERLGTYYTNINVIDSAEVYLTRSIENYSINSDSIDLSYALQRLADLYLIKKNPESALNYVERALDLVKFPKGENLDLSLLHNRNIDDFYDPLELKGRILFDHYKKYGKIYSLNASLKTFQNIEYIAETVRSGVYSEGTKTVVSEHFRRAAKGALRTLQALQKLSSELEYLALAFNFMEHNRYAQLSQNLVRLTSSRAYGVPDSLVRKLNYLVSEIERLEQLVQLEISSSQTSSGFNDSLLTYKNNYQSLIDKGATLYPGYFQVRYEDMFSIWEIQEKMDANSQLLEYFWGDSIISLLSITADTAFLTSIPIKNVEKILDVLLPWLVHRHIEKDTDLNFNEFAKLSHKLYLNLLYPYLQTGIERIIISTDGDLAYLPFGVLILDPSQGNWRDGSYLIRNFEVQYINSSNLLYKNLSSGPLKKPQVLAMGYSTAEDAMQTPSRKKFQEIPHTAREVDAVRKKFKPGKVFRLKGSAATETAFKNLVPDSDMVHLALHGIGDTTSAVRSHLVFKNELDSLDGNLYAFELYKLSLKKTRLAVLSACETGVGKSYAGEGIFSIARGFAYAGIPSLVMSLWKADDVSTETLMASFYQHLAKGNTISRSIQQSKLEYLENAQYETCRPYYWAAFVAVGDVAPVVAGSHVYIKYFLITILVILLFWVTRKLLLKNLSDR